MSKKFPIKPSSPERICWGCDKFCPANDLACGNGSGRTQHPIELLGDDWYKDFGIVLSETETKNFDPSKHNNPEDEHK